MAGAGQGSGTNTFGHCFVENRRQNFSIHLQWQKIDRFSGLGEERRTPRANFCPLDHGSTRYLRGRHLHPLALPDTKRVGRGLILLCRDRRSIVTQAEFDQRVHNFQLESTDMCSRVDNFQSESTDRFRRVQPCDKKELKKTHLQ